MTNVAGSGYRSGRVSPRRVQDVPVEVGDGIEVTLLIQQYAAAKKAWEAAQQAHKEAYERYLDCRRLMIRAGFVLNAGQD